MPSEQSSTGLFAGLFWTLGLLDDVPAAFSNKLLSQSSPRMALDNRKLDLNRKYQLLAVICHAEPVCGASLPSVQPADGSDPRFVSVLSTCLWAISEGRVQLGSALLFSQLCVWGGGSAAPTF